MNILNGTPKTDVDQLTSNTVEPIKKFENLLEQLDQISQPSSSNNSTTKLLIDELKGLLKKQLQEKDKRIKQLEDQTTSEQQHELRNKLIEEKDKTISELRERINKLSQKRDMQLAEVKGKVSKLEEKLEMKDSELIQLRSQVTEVTVRLEERDKQLLQMRLEADKQLTEAKIQLQEWADTANKLINGRADFDEWKKQFQKMSVPNSVVPSPDQSCINHQNGSVSPLAQIDSEDEQMQINTNSKYQKQRQSSSNVDMKDEEKLKKDSTQTGRLKCAYCTCITSKTLDMHYRECDLKIRFNYIVCSYGKQWKAVLTEGSFTHITKHSDFKQMFSEFCQGLSGDELNAVHQLQEDLLKANDIDPTSLHGEYYCSLCETNFVRFGVRFQHYQFCEGLKQHYDNVTQQLQAYKDKAEEEEQKKIQTVIDFKGNMLRGVINSVNLVEQLILTDKKAKEIYGDDYKQLLQLHKLLHQKDYFKG